MGDIQCAVSYVFIMVVQVPGCVLMAIGGIIVVDESAFFKGSFLRMGYGFCGEY